jgi:hypothetical protein
VVLSPQTVQVKGENGNLVITPEGNVTFNGKQYNLTAAQREQAKDYQAELRTALPWINEGALTRVEKAAWRWIRSSPKRWGEQQHAHPPDEAGQAAERTDEPHYRDAPDGLTFHYKRSIRSVPTGSSW